MRTKRRKDYFEIEKDARRKRERAKERALGFPNSVRIVLNGQTIEHTPKRLGQDFALRLSLPFWDWIRKAICQPEAFLFVGFGGPMQAPLWLAFHEKRLGVELKGEFQLLDGDKVLDSFCTL